MPRRRLTDSDRVVGHYGLADGDLAGFLADFSPEIAVFRPLGFAGAGGVAKGLTAIGPVFATLFAEFAKLVHAHGKGGSL